MRTGTIKKTALSLALIAALLLALSAGALAETIYTEGTLYYTVEDNSITIVGCFGRDAEVTIPSQIAGTPVNTIASGAFADNDYVKTVYVPGTVTSIEEGAMGNADVVFIGGSGTAESSATAAPVITSAPVSESTAQPTASPIATAAPTAYISGSSAVSSSSSTVTASSSTSTSTANSSASAISTDTYVPPIGTDSDFFETDVYIDETGEISDVEYDTSFFETVKEIATGEEYSTTRLIVLIILILVAIILLFIFYVKPNKKSTGRH